MSNFRDEIRVAHLAVTAETMINNTDQDYRNLAGLAGDLIQLAGVMQDKYNSEFTKMTHRYTDKEIDVLALVVAFQLMFGQFTALIWGEKLAQAFGERIYGYISNE